MIDIERAKESETRKHMDDRFDRIESNLSDMRKSWNRVLWVVMAAVIAAATKWVIGGGLAG